MANSRELAEQAIALLQNALTESEARASELDEQLKRKRAPKTRLEEQLDVLAHRLESVETERTRWEQQAGHLEEIAEAERAKVAQLKKKLELAESGPDKLTKKEINFWRQKAEEIDAQIKEYQERLTGVRRELIERDALIESLRTNGAAATAPDSSDGAEADAELRRQLEQRDGWLADLRLELHELRAQPSPPLETQAEVETLRSQIAGLERALAESHSQRAAAQADAARTQQDIDARERAIREANSINERARATLGEREHRIVELSAEVEHLRNDLRQQDEQRLEQASQHDEQVGTLTRDIEALRGRLEQDRHDTSAARAALELALHERELEVEKQHQLVKANERDFAELTQQLAQREQAMADVRRQLDAQHSDVQERDRELAARQQQLLDLSQELVVRDQRLANLNGELEQLQGSLAAQGQEIDSLREALQNANREIDHAHTTLTANEREVSSLRETVAASSRELDELRAHKQRHEHELQDLRGYQQQLEQELEASRGDQQRLRNELDESLNSQHHLAQVVEEAKGRAAIAARDFEAAREQLAGLETELKEEREHAESLGELANERREHMTKLQEQVEEAEERFADANWRLGKSLHFERIVKRRKGLILQLIEALRAKMKTNVALKAGLDGLRTFKAGAEMNQHKLLQRIDSLKADLKEADETVKRHQGGTAAKEELTSAISKATALEDRLNTQAELIQSLEADLKTAKLSHKAGDGQQQEVERLKRELEAKNQLIAKLEADTDDQQRKLSKLRGSESETVRLKALTEKDRSEIDSLQREITQLRDTLARQTAAAAASGNNADLEAKLKERENSVTRLMGTIKEHEATIKKLNESSDSWKRKYQFLASDQPDAYKNAAEK